MAEPILSPDGKWMWTGDEWIPAPPTSSQSANLNLQDSVIGGDVNINQTIVQPDISSIKQIFDDGINRLIEMGFGGHPVEIELSQEEQKEITEIINISEQARGHGIDITPWTEMTIGMAGLNTGRFESAMNNFTRAKSKFESLNENEGISASLLSVGTLKEWMGDLQDAERYYHESKSLSEGINDLQLQAFAINNLGKISLYRNEYNIAKGYFENSLSICMKINDTMGQGIAIHNLGLVSSKLGDVQAAISYYQQSLDLETEDLGRAITLNNIGQSLTLLENTIEARQFIQQAMAIAVENDSAPLLALVLNNLGVIEMEEGNLIAARKNYSEAKEINEKIGSQLQLVQVLFNLADLSFLEHDEQSTHIYNQQAVNLSREIGLPINQWFIDNGY
tara:strand:+ start:3158 stop:4336 length:1179 start_codon:yes stop_codon:yes gene_type:complete